MTGSGVTCAKLNTVSSDVIGYLKLLSNCLGQGYKKGKEKEWAWP